MASKESSSLPLLQSSKNPTHQAPASIMSTRIQSTTNMPTKLESCFTKSQFALALVIQRSKPEGVSVGDYCLQLRNNVRQHGSLGNKSHRHVDTCEFWKDQYMKIYNEKRILEDRLTILEEVQQAELRRTVSDTEDAITLNENGKRSKLFDEVQEILDTPREEIAHSETSILRLCRYVLQIGQRRAHLEKAAKESDTPEYLDNIVNSSNQALKLLEIALDECTTPLWSLKYSDDTRLVHLLQQLAHQMILCFQSCFNALNELCRTIIGRSKRLGIVYRLAMFFKTALGHLHTICTLQTENEGDGKLKTRKKRPKTDAEYAVNKYLSQALISIIRLEWKVGSPGHRDILEGILFSTLAHTGRLVSNAVFNEHVAVSDKVGNITPGDTDITSPGAHLEARYFIPILREAIGTSSNRRELISKVLCDGRRDSKDQNQATNPHVQETPTQHLLIKARKRLQETLVKYAVGGTELDSLAMPEQPDHPDDELEPSCEAEKYSREWLLESVWGIVGWELAI